MSASELSATAWALLVIAALLIGFSKTAIGGMALISVAICAAVLPSRASTGIVLPMLIVGDIYAVRAYRRHADRRLLRQLLPAIVVGVIGGSWFIANVDDATMRRTIGVIVLALVGLHLLNRQRAAREDPGDKSPPDPPTGRQGSALLASLIGVLTGFTTMTANAGGPVVSLYLLAARYSVMAFLGTVSWLFFTVNLIKVPFAMGLGLITADTLLLNAMLAPAVIIGALFGTRIIPHVPQATFENLVLATSVAAALNLLR